MNDIECRFVPIFGASKQHVSNVWKGEGDLKGFNHHLQQVAKNWAHISISPNLWTSVSPQSSTSAHLYLKAIQLCSIQGKLDERPPVVLNGRSRFEEAIWAFRDAFFSQGRDVSHRGVQDEIAEGLQLPLMRIHEFIDTGQAYAALH